MINCLVCKILKSEKLPFTVSLSPRSVVKLEPDHFLKIEVFLFTVSRLIAAAQKKRVENTCYTVPQPREMHSHSSVYSPDSPDVQFIVTSGKTKAPNSHISECNAKKLRIFA